MRNGMHANLLGALTVVLLLGAPAPESPVADAAMAGDIQTVRSLLRDGEDVNAASALASVGCSIWGAWTRNF